MKSQRSGTLSALSLLPIALGLCAGCAVQTAPEEAASQQLGTEIVRDDACRRELLTPSVIGTLGVPPTTHGVVEPGLPVIGTSSLANQAPNCPSAYEIEAIMPTFEPSPPPVPESVVFLVDLVNELPARSDCATAMHMSYEVSGLQNGSWVTVFDGTGTPFEDTNDCTISAFAQLTLAQAEAYSEFRLSAVAYLEEGTTLTDLPVSLIVQQDPTQ